MLPLVREHGAAIICLVNDETGIPATAQARLELCKRLVDAVHGRYEVPLEDIEWAMNWIAAHRQAETARA